MTAYVRGPHDTWVGAAGLAVPCAGRTYGHNGGMNGFASSALASADGSRAAVILLNGRIEGGSGDGIGVEAVRRLFCAAR